MPEHLTFKNRPLSLAHVVRRLVPKEWGGTETVVLTICRHLQDRGVRSRILATSALSREGSDRIGGIPVQRFSYRYPLWGLPASKREQMDKKGGNPLSFSLFWYLLNQSDLGLVHLHTMGRLAAQVRMACRIRGIPYVLSLHGGHFCVPAQEQQYFRNLTRGYYDYGKPLGLLFGTRRVMADAAGIICVGYDEYCSARTQFPEKRVGYLPHGVDVHYWGSGNAESFRDAHGLVGRRIVLCVGRIDPQKNQLALIRAFPRILSRCRDASLVLIGPISVPSYLNECEKQIIAAGLENRILIIPGLPLFSQDLLDAYAACEVFVLPSIHEPFGLVVLEAWAFSKPVVVSAVGSLQHVVQDGVTGLHVENADEETLAEGVLQILRNQSLAIRLGRKGQEAIEATYTWDRNIDGLMELYSEVLGNGDRIQSLGPNPIAHERGRSGGRIYSSPL